jgi:hypothetical protein
LRARRGAAHMVTICREGGGTRANGERASCVAALPSGCKRRSCSWHQLPRRTLRGRGRPGGPAPRRQRQRQVRDAPGKKVATLAQTPIQPL